MIEHGDYIYLIKPAEVWRAENSGSEELADLTVVSYDLDGERMTVVLHDADGNLAGSSLLVEGGRLSVARGLVTMVGAERVTLHTFDVMSVEIVGAKLTVKAETALARMRRWVSEYTLTWTGTPRNLLERLGGGGGIHAGGVGGGAGGGHTVSGGVGGGGG